MADERRVSDPAIEVDLPPELDAIAKTQRRRRRWLTALVAVALVSSYTVAYLYEGEPRWTYRKDSKWERSRQYRSKSLAHCFIPAAWVESQYSGKIVVLKYPTLIGAPMSAWQTSPVYEFR